MIIAKNGDENSRNYRELHQRNGIRSEQYVPDHLIGATCYYVVVDKYGRAYYEGRNYSEAMKVLGGKSQEFEAVDLSDGIDKSVRATARISKDSIDILSLEAL